MRLHRLDEWPSEQELRGMEKEAMMLGEMAEALLDEGNSETLLRGWLEFQVACAVTQLVGLVRKAGLADSGEPIPK